MALKRILGSAVRHPVATAALGVGVAKGSVEVARRLVRPGAPEDPAVPEAEQETAPEAAAEAGQPTDTAPPEPEVVAPDPERDLPEPVVIYAEDDEPAPAPDVDPQAEDEVVWTSESSAPPTSD